MNGLRSAYVQRLYRPLSLVFVALAIAVVGGAAYAAWSSTVITLTPKLRPVSTTLTLTIGPDSDTPDRLVGSVTTDKRTATVSAAPQGTGQSVPAHATGTMTIVNTTATPQPLTVGTRLRATNGVIVRTKNRVDVPAGGQVDVGVIADPLGTEGELSAGKFVIVALWTGLQKQIFGQTSEAMVGGTATESSQTLSLEELTTASTSAQDKIRTEVGTSTAGTYRSLEPADVTTIPDLKTPSATYQVIVTSTAVTVTYSNDELQSVARRELTKVLADGDVLASMSVPTLTLSDRPTKEVAVFKVKVEGQAVIAGTSALLQPSTYTGLGRNDIEQQTVGAGLFTSTSVTFSPWWRKAAPDQAGRITIRTLTSRL